MVQGLSEILERYDKTCHKNSFASDVPDEVIAKYPSIEKCTKAQSRQRLLCSNERLLYGRQVPGSCYWFPENSGLFGIKFGSHPVSASRWSVR